MYQSEVTGQTEITGSSLVSWNAASARFGHPEHGQASLGLLTNLHDWAGSTRSGCVGFGLLGVAILGERPHCVHGVRRSSVFEQQMNVRAI